MTIYRYDDALIEVTVLSDPKSDGWVVEMWDLQPNGRGEFAHIIRSPTGDLALDLLGKSLNVDLAVWAIETARAELENY